MISQFTAGYRCIGVSDRHCLEYTILAYTVSVCDVTAFLSGNQTQVCIHMPCWKKYVPQYQN